MVEKRPNRPDIRLKVSTTPEEIERLRRLATPETTMTAALKRAIQEAQSPKEKHN